MTRRYKRPLPYAQQAALIKAYRNPPHVRVQRQVGEALINRGLVESVDQRSPSSARWGKDRNNGIYVRLTEAGRLWNLGVDNHRNDR